MGFHENWPIEFPFIAPVALAGCTLLLVAVVAYLLCRVRRIQATLEVIRSDLWYANPEPNARNSRARKNEYRPGPAKTKRASVNRQDSQESITIVPSRQPSLRIVQLSSTPEMPNESTPDIAIEMEDIYQNEEAIQLNLESGERLAAPNMEESHVLATQQSRDEYMFSNEAFEVDVNTEGISEPIYMNRGDLADVHNPEFEFLTQNEPDCQA